MRENEAIVVDIEAQLALSGLKVLELSVSKGRGEVRVRTTVYSPAGTGTAECTKAHKLIVARLAQAHGIEEPYVEVSSPGIDRQFKSSRDYEVFAGSRIRFLRQGEGEWTRARLVGMEGDILSLETSEGAIAVPLAEIAKARLDSTPEGD